VGISHYDTALTGHQWNDINGAEDVALLTPILKGQGFSTTSLLDKEATHDNIISQLNKFTHNTKRGDIIYLHFSGHGQPMEDLSGDETDGWDETLVPVDAYKIYKKGVYEGKKHILDDQTNTYINRLRTIIGPIGFLYITIDACHAGTSSRGNDETVRGTHMGFCFHRGLTFKPSGNKTSHYHVAGSNKMCNVMFIEACRADQVNKEIKVAGRQYGALSYNISLALKQCELSKSPQTFVAKIKKSIMSCGHWPDNQNIVIETSY
jgi:hypothetical protein